MTAIDTGGPHLLVVEDSPTQAAALMALLEDHGFAATAARSGEKALALLSGEAASAGTAGRPFGFSLVLSDVVMPGMSGYDLCRRIKAEPWGGALPVVLLTSLGDPLALVRGLESGADHYVTKPYEPERLVARVRQVIGAPLTRDAPGERPVQLSLLGNQFTIAAGKERIIELLVSSYEDLVRTSEAMRAAEQRARFLSEAGELLSSSLDAERVLQDMARLAVPRIADVCTVDVIEADGVVRRVEVAVAASGAAAAADALRDRVERWDALRPGAAAGRPTEMLLQVEPSMLARVAEDEAHRALLESLGASSVLVVPLVARGVRLGTLTLMRTSSARGFLPDDIDLATELARRAALALDNAQLYHVARAATQSRDDVMAIVSHDLRNPLHTIQMSASFVLELLDSEGGAAHIPAQLAIVRRAAARANTLIQDLLDVSRIESGRLAVKAVPMDGRTLLEEGMEELAPLARAKPLDLTYEWTGEAAQVLADRERIAQVLSNLVGNAMKFTPPDGTIRVRAARRGAVAVFEVQDSGEGIPPTHLPNVFERFWQADRSARQGAGLGLYIVRGIIEAHDGRIDVESTLGEGTCFRFELPLAPDGAVVTPPAT